MTKQGIIRIKLNSDLSAGSGYSYAGIIDSDVCYDRYGLPYIPAKRLKGCLREVAENEITSILEHPVDELFGKGGQRGVTGLTVGNAYIGGRDKLAEQIKSLRKKGKAWKHYTDKQIILDKFTTVKAQTKLADGVADDQTLRYTRTVNGFSPITGSETVFFAQISYDDTLETDIENIIKGLRNMGIMRNRGLGSVSCSLEKAEEETVPVEENQDLSGDKVEISYVLTNVQPLMISASRDDVSVKYIPGQNILGMMASRYLAIPGNSPEDKMFKDLFLGGKAIFSDAVPYHKGHIYYPAPAFVNELKKTSVLVNAEKSRESVSEIENPEYRTENGNLPKKLRGKFVAIEDGTAGPEFGTHDVGMRVVYHHDHRKQDDGNQGRLYIQTVVEEEQQFTGRIIIPARYLLKEPEKDIVSMLKKPGMYFGKSKTAQYGLCRLIDVKVSDYRPESVNIKPGSEILVTILSDAIFTDENGYTVDHDTVAACICKDLGISGEPSRDMNSHSIVQTKKIYGYQTVWNLRKQPVPAIEAGSVYAIKVAEGTDDAIISREFVGERNLEGFGHVKVLASDDVPYMLKKLSDEEKSTEGIRMDDDLKKLLTEIVVDNICDIKRKEVINGDIFDNSASMDISASLRGRLTLMLVESIDRFPEESQWEERSTDFVKRVESIKSNDVNRIKAALAETIFDSKELRKIDIGKLADQQHLDYLKNDLGCSDDKIRNKICNMWSEVLMTMLVNDKYIKGEQ